MYTAAENAEMLILYGECRHHAREDAREYAIRFPQRLPHPIVVYLTSSCVNWGFLYEWASLKRE
jgi:hypothetical protein